MSTRRPISISLDAQASARRIVVGTELAAPSSSDRMDLYYGTENLFQATIYNGAITTAFNPITGAAWLFGIDSVFTSGHADPVLSENDQFNIPGDWADLNVAAGKISWRATLATTQLKAVLDALGAGTEYTTMYAYLWMLPPGGGHVLIAKWDVRVYRVAVDPVTATATSPIGGITPAQAAASFVPIWGDQARWRWRDGGWQYLFEEDSAWRALAPRIIDGVPTIAWSDPL